MATTYSNNLGISIFATGDLINSWGPLADNNMSTFLEQAVAGVVGQNFTSSNVTLTMTNGADGGGSTTAGTIYGSLSTGSSGTPSSPVSARNIFIKCTGTLGTSTPATLTVPAKAKLYFIQNATTDSPAQALTVSCTGSNTVSIPNGATTVVYCDGTNVYPALTSIPSTSYFTKTVNINPVSGSSQIALTINLASSGYTINSTSPSGNSNTIRLGQTGVYNWDFINGATSGNLTMGIQGTAYLQCTPAGAWTINSPNATGITPLKVTQNSTSGNTNGLIIDGRTGAINAGTSTSTTVFQVGNGSGAGNGTYLRVALTDNTATTLVDANSSAGNPILALSANSRTGLTLTGNGTVNINNPASGYGALSVTGNAANAIVVGDSGTTAVKINQTTGYTAGLILGNTGTVYGWAIQNNSGVYWTTVNGFTATNTYDIVYNNGTANQSFLSITSAGAVSVSKGFTAGQAIVSSSGQSTVYEGLASINAVKNVATYEKGTFTGSLNIAGSVAATGTIYWTRNGNLVTIDIPSDLSATSGTNNPTIYISGAPSSLTPARSQYFSVNTVVGSTYYTGYVLVGPATSGNINLYSNYNLGVPNKANNPFTSSATQFLGGAAAGIAGGSSFTYSLT
jgi:hypothetical protein